MYHLILLLPRLLTNKYHTVWADLRVVTVLLLVGNHLITPMGIDQMNSSYVSRTSHRECLVTEVSRSEPISKAYWINSRGKLKIGSWPTQ